MTKAAQAVEERATAIAAAIGRRDVETLAWALAPGFVHRTPGGAAVEAAAFLEGVRQIPGEILFVRLEGVAVDVVGHQAVVTGIQTAQVRVEGATVDDRRAFVDWFVEAEGEWRLRLAVDLPAPPL